MPFSTFSVTKHRVTATPIARHVDTPVRHQIRPCHALLQLCTPCLFRGRLIKNIFAVVTTVRVIQCTCENVIALCACLTLLTSFSSIFFHFLLPDNALSSARSREPGKTRDTSLSSSVILQLYAMCLCPGVTPSRLVSCRRCAYVRRTTISQFDYFLRSCILHYVRICIRYRYYAGYLSNVLRPVEQTADG